MGTKVPQNLPTLMAVHYRSTEISLMVTAGLLTNLPTIYTATNHDGIKQGVIRYDVLIAVFGSFPTSHLKLRWT